MCHNILSCKHNSIEAFIMLTTTLETQVTKKLFCLFVLPFTSAISGPISSGQYNAVMFVQDCWITVAALNLLWAAQY